MKKLIELTHDELMVLQVALEKFDPIRIYRWECDGYEQDTDKTEYIDNLYNKLLDA